MLIIFYMELSHPSWENIGGVPCLNTLDIQMDEKLMIIEIATKEIAQIVYEKLDRVESDF